MKPQAHLRIYVNYQVVFYLKEHTNSSGCTGALETSLCSVNFEEDGFELVHVNSTVVALGSSYKGVLVPLARCLPLRKVLFCFSVARVPCWHRQRWPGHAAQHTAHVIALVVPLQICFRVVPERHRCAASTAVSSTSHVPLLFRAPLQIGLSVVPDSQ